MARISPMKNKYLFSSVLCLSLGSSYASVTITGLGAAAAHEISYGDTTTVASGSITTTDLQSVGFSYQVLNWGTAVPEVGAPSTIVQFQGSGRFEVNAYGTTSSSSYTVGANVTGPTIRVTFDEALSLVVGMQENNGIRNDGTGLFTTTNVVGLATSLTDPGSQLISGSSALDLDIDGDLQGTSSTWSAAFGDTVGQTSGATVYDFQFNWDASNNGTHVEAFQIQDAFTVVPEPSSAGLLGIAALASLLHRRRK